MLEFSKLTPCAVLWFLGRPVLFTGEMVFPWMLEDFKELMPLRETAHLVAKATDWRKLYNVESLGSNSVPVASATYIEVIAYLFKEDVIVFQAQLHIGYSFKILFGCNILHM